MNIDDFLQESTEEIIQIRRSLHQCAELSTLEYETGDLIRDYLERWRIPYDYPIAETGIVAEIHGTASRETAAPQNRDFPSGTAVPQSNAFSHETAISLNHGQSSGRVVALRAEMDALPIYEKRHPCCSKNPGVMHACGHDAHMAIALGTAHYFSQNTDAFSGCIKFFFQPAEETIGGAARMIEDGCMTNPDVDYVVGLHVAPSLPTGSIEVKYGKLYAASDEVSLTVNGKSCHGAYPDQGVDAIVLASQLVGALQTIVSRSVSPTDQCLLSLGTIQGGKAHNILADTVTLTGALRTTDPDTRKQVKERIAKMSEEIPAAMGGQGRAVFSPGYDALINTDALVDLLVQTATPLLGREHIHWKPSPGMGVEDFSFFLQKAPGVFFHLGCGNQKKGISAPLHSREFALDEDCLAIGVRLETALIQQLLGR